MQLDELKRHWNRFGETDPLWAILTDPACKDGKWDTEEFFRTGQREIAAILKNVQTSLSDFRCHPSAEWEPLNGNSASPGAKLGGMALDFGCGVGRITQALCHYFAECHGVDIAPSMIEWASGFNRYGSRCVYHVNDRPDLQLFAPRTFDFIYSNIVLQHME